MDLCAHAFDFGKMHEPLGKDVFGNGADSFGGGEEGAKLGLHVGGESGIGLGAEFEREPAAISPHADGIGANIEVMPGGEESIGNGGEMGGVEAGDGDIVAGEGGCGEEGAGFDAVGDDGVFGAVELGDTFDDDAVGACAFDFCAHFDEEICEIDDLGFLGRTVDDGGAFGENGGHQDIIGAEDGGAKFAAQIDAGADEAAGKEFNVTPLDADSGAESFEAFEVKIDGAVANDAAAGHGDGGFFFASEQGTKDADRGAHFPDDVVRGFGVNFFRANLDDAAGPFDIGTEFGEDLLHKIHVAKVGHAVDDAGFAGKKSGGENREGGIFRTADADIAFETGTAVNENFIHCAKGYQ